MNWKMKYQQLTNELYPILEELGIRSSYVPFEELADGEKTCRRLMKLVINAKSIREATLRNNNESARN